MSQSKLVFAISIAIAVIPQACFGAPQDGVKSLPNSSTQAAQESSQTDIPTEAEKARVKAEVAEIMAIREQLGGGVAATLGDLSLEMPGGKPQDSAAPKQTSDESFAKKLAAQSEKHAAREMIPKGYQLVKINDREKANRNHEQCEAIRHAARMLEEAAAHLEEAQQYHQADDIREKARQLWQSAR